MKAVELKMPDMDKWAKELNADYDGARRAGLINLTADIEAYAVKGAPVRSSNLANSGGSDVNTGGTRGTVFFSAPYAAFVHEGTGLYGPHKTRIVPKDKKALFWPGAAHPVRSVKGMKGNPFLSDAAERVDVNRSFSDGINNYLQQRGR